jgi:hypothetical protein
MSGEGRATGLCMVPGSSVAVGMAARKWQMNEVKTSRKPAIYLLPEACESCNVPEETQSAGVKDM